MNSRIHFLQGVGICLVLVSISWPALAQEWVALYDGGANSRDDGYAIAVDDSGYVYVTGGSAGVGSSIDYATIKYGPDGSVVWTRRYNGPANGDDHAMAIAIGRDYCVYVTGESQRNPSSTGLATVKYSPAGVEVWAQRHDRSGNSKPYAIVVDDSDYVYVAGKGSYYVNGMYVSGGDYLTVKYSPNGAEVWERSYGGPHRGVDAARALAVDDSGFVYVTGGSAGESYRSDMTTIKYGPDGTTIWLQRYVGGFYVASAANDIGLDADGHIFVAGMSNDDFVTVRYAPNGDARWARRLNGTASQLDWVAALAVDAGGDVCVTGSSQGIGSGSDYLTAKYSPSGDMLWSRRSNGIRNADDAPTAIVADGEGNFYVTGSCQLSTGKYECVTLKYSPAGDVSWRRSFRFLETGSVSAASAAVAHDGSVYITGSCNDWNTYSDYATIKYVPCAVDVSGDLDGDGFVSPSDIMTMVTFVFRLQAWPGCEAIGDVNCDGIVNSGDVIFLVNHLYRLGPEPCDACNSTLAAACR